MKQRALALGSVLLVLGACGSSGEPPAGDAIEHYLAAVTSGDGTVVGQLRSGSLPSGSGPSVQATSSGALLPGAGRSFTVSSTSAIDRIVVGVDGAPGYYELTGLTPAVAQSLLLTVSQTAPSSFSFLFAGGSGNALGSSSTLPVTLTSVGTGDVQVSLTWDVDSDVDLHVVDPAGEEIYYGHPTSASGGELDLDSNAGCALDHKRAENITWPSGKAPKGEYWVGVDYWDACTQAETRFAITVNVMGKLYAPYGTSYVQVPLTGPGDQAGQCWDAQTSPCSHIWYFAFVVPQP